MDIAAAEAEHNGYDVFFCHTHFYDETCTSLQTHLFFGGGGTGETLANGSNEVSYELQYSVIFQPFFCQALNWKSARAFCLSSGVVLSVHET